MFARDECARTGVSFSDAFRYQYVISRHAVPGEGLRRHRLGAWHLQIGDQAQLARLIDRDGLHIGYLIGIAVGPEGVIAGDWRCSQLSAGVPDFFDRFERCLNDLAGRFTILVASGGEERIYSDPVGMNGVVYCRDTKRVASSTLLCFDDDLKPDPMFDHAINEQEGGKYGLFHTRDARVRRMNPSFFLDLANFQESRYWPRPDSLAPKPLSQIYDEIATTTRHNIAAIAGRFPTAMPLSGGRDSRLLAALAGAHVHDIGQIYTHITNYATRIDAAIAARVADRIGVSHEVHDKRVLPRKRWRVDQKRRAYAVASGGPAPLPDPLRLDLDEAIAPDAVVMRGHQTDILRAVYVRKPDPRQWKDFRWQVEWLLMVPRARFTDEIYERFLPEFSAWFSTLPPGARAIGPDFMFLELYYPASLGPFFAGMHRNFYLSPFNSRRLVELALSIDVAYRLGARPIDDLIHLAAPDLLPVPFDNEFGADLGDLDGELPLRDKRVRETRERAQAMAGVARRDIALADRVRHVRTGGLSMTG